MIEYVEIRNQNREIIGIVDVFNSVIWHCEYYGTGDFEIYAPCSALNLELLIAGNFVTRPNDDNVGLIESVNYSFDITNGRMITATGRFAKCILDRRIIYRLTENTVSTTILNGNVETTVRSVVNMNAIDCPFDSGRNISGFVLGEHSGSTQIIVDANGDPTQQQVAFDNLLTWSNEFLRQYKIGARVILNDSKKLEYICWEGKNRAVDNLDGNDPVIFSQDFENLVSSDFEHNERSYKNAALIGGEGEGIARFCAVLIPAETGIDRRETFVDGSKTAKKYKDSAGNEHTLSNAVYESQLIAIGAQKLATLPILQTFNGEINLNSLTFKYKSNYNLGDIITVQDSDTKLYINTRIIEITEIQDEKGYQLTGKYES